MSHRIRQTKKLAQSLRIAPLLRQKLQEMSLSIRIDLINALREQDYKPKGDCPFCERKMKPLEIIKGFNNDPTDFTTMCTGCGKRFEPVMIARSNFASVEFPFYCAAQTLDQLKYADVNLPPEEFKQKYPAVYHSAVFHHGGLTGAFRKIGINYPHQEIPDWKRKIEPFLGRLPDTIIAECANASVKAVRLLRKERGITSYNVRKTLAEVEAQA